MKEALFLPVCALAACSWDNKVEPLRVCEPGTMKCGSNPPAVLVCSDDGMAWEVHQECIKGARCVAASCRCPAGWVAGTEECILVGVADCPDGFQPKESGCAELQVECAAGEAATISGCTPVGVRECPGEGWVPDPDTGGCKVPEVECKEGEEPFIKASCKKVGAVMSCGELDEPWPKAIPQGTVIYVYSATAVPPDDQDGSKLKPYSDLAKGIAAAPPGGTVLVGTGMYSGGLVVDKPLSILGKCPKHVTIVGGSETEVSFSDLPARYSLVAQADGKVSISGVRILSDPAAGPDEWNGGILLEGCSECDVSNVVLEGLRGAAIHLEQCDNATISNVEVSDTRLVEGVNAYGQVSHAVLASGVQKLVVEGSRFAKTQGTDIRADKGTCPEVRNSVFIGRGPPGGLVPMGIWVTGCMSRATVVDDCVFRDKMTHAILVDGGDAVITFNRISGTVTDYDDVNGPSIKLTDTKFKVEGNFLLDNQHTGIAVLGGEGGISGNRVEGTRATDGMKYGEGIIVQGVSPGSVTVRNNTLVGNTRNALFVSSSIATLEYNLALGTLPSPAPNVFYGAGISVLAGSDASVVGNAVVGNHLLGIKFDRSYGKVEGNIVTQTVVQEGVCGGGIVIGNDATLSGGIKRNLVTGNSGVGILVEDSSIEEISGNIVEKTFGQPGVPGIGIAFVRSDGKIQGNNVRGNQDTGLLLHESTGVVIGNLFQDNGRKGAGGGVVVQDCNKIPIKLAGNTFSGNGLAGLIVRASLFETSSNAFLENRANAEGEGGAGAWIGTDSEGVVKLSSVTGNLLAGLLAFSASDVTFSLNYVAGTKTGGLVTSSGPIQLAEGIVLAGGSFGSVLGNTVSGNGKAGVLFHESEGVVSGNQIQNNGGWGMELVHSAVTREENVYISNAEGEETELSDRLGPEEDLAPVVVCTAR